MKKLVLKVSGLMLLMFLFANIGWGQEVSELLTLDTEGVYKIINAGANLDLNAACLEGKAKQTTNINLYTKMDNGDHYFKFVYSGPNTYFIQNLSNTNELYLNIEGLTKSSIKNGSNIYLWGPTNSGMSDFQFKKLENGNYVILYDDDHNLVLGSEGTTLNSNVSLQTYNPSSVLQQWIIEKVDSESSLPVGPEILSEQDGELDFASTYRIVGVASNKDLNTYSLKGQAKAGTNINLWDREDNGDHYFQLMPIRSGTFWIRNLSNGSSLFLNVYGLDESSVKSGANVHLWGPTNSGMSDFRIEKIENDTYIIRYDGQPDLVLTADGAASGDNVSLRTYTGGLNQQWRFENIKASQVHETLPNETEKQLDAEDDRTLTSKLDLTGVSIDEWAIEPIQELYSLGFVDPSLFNNYMDVMSRQDFAKLAVNLYEFISDRPIQVDASIKFVDTSDTDILKAATVGITKGVGDNRFEPRGHLTREELAALTIRTIELAGINLFNAEGKLFSDDEEIAGWAKKYIYLAKVNSIIDGIGGNKFLPKGTVKVEEALVLVNKFINSEEVKDTLRRVVHDETSLPLFEYQVGPQDALVRELYTNYSKVIHTLKAGESVSIFKVVENGNGLTFGKTQNGTWIELSQLINKTNAPIVTSQEKPIRQNVPVRKIPAAEAEIVSRLSDQDRVAIKYKFYNDRGNLWAMTSDRTVIYSGNLELAFVPRTTPPEWGSSIYYPAIDYANNRFTYPGDQKALLWKNGNCVAYTYARAYEILGYKLDEKFKVNAKNWSTVNKENGFFDYGSTPREGAIAVFGPTSKYPYGHVAIVEKIDNEKIYFSESGWNNFEFFYGGRMAIPINATKRSWGAPIDTYIYLLD